MTWLTKHINKCGLSTLYPSLLLTKLLEKVKSVSTIPNGLK